MDTSLRPSIALLLVVTAATLVVGLLGTAVAGPAMTKGKVKKIATKVVKKQASSLSVANAQTLAGRPASAYEERAIVYTVEVPGSVDDDEDFRLDIQPGTYAFTYSARLLSGDGPTSCVLRRRRGEETLFVGRDQTTGPDPALSASGVMEVASGDVVVLKCSSGAPFHTFSAEPIQIVATPLAAVATGLATYTH